MDSEPPHSQGDRSDQEAAWFRSVSCPALSGSQRIAELHHRLDSALTLARSYGSRSDAAIILKYELRSGLLDDQRQFRSTCLTGPEVDSLPRLASIQRALDALIENIDQNGPRLTRGLTADPDALDDVLRQSCELQRSIDSVIDGCLEVIATP